MKCPTCANSVLVMAERQGVEIDYCPTCRGVWLDRGELDKLLAVSATREAAQPARSEHVSSRRPDFEDSDYKRRSGHYGHSKRKSWLSEIFD